MKSISRRGFLAGSAAALAVMAFRPDRLRAGLLDRLLGRPRKPMSPITANADFYITSSGGTPRLKAESWSLHVKGLVKNPLTLTYEDLLKRTNVAMISTLECIGNPIGGDSIGTAEWEGVKLREILDEAGAGHNAVDLVLRGADGYSDSFPAKHAMRDEVLLVTRMNGVPLPAEHGFPTRVIVPGIYGMKSVKWLTELELVEKDYKGYWETRGWSDEAVVKVRSRIDQPEDGETVTGKSAVIRGIAVGGLYGVARVEVSTDGGTHFHDAQLEPPLSPYAWRFWAYTWPAPSAGHHTLIVRATDTRGVAQEQAPGQTFPNGAAGLHEISVTVTAT